MEDIRERIIRLQKQYLEDLQRLVSIPSVHGERSADDAPFGTEVRNAFDAFLSIGQRLGFTCFDDEGYACGMTLGSGSQEIAILGHLDVVDAGDLKLWSCPPYQVSDQNGILCGRGVNDDKGPLLAALYAMYLLKEEGLPLKRSIRLIAGGAEETTWEGIHHYFAKHPQPLFGFSPDGDFPIVNGEMGIFKFSFLFDLEDENIQIHSNTPDNLVCDHLSLSYEDQTGTHTETYTGRRALSRHPERGENAVWKFLDAYDDLHIKSEALNDCVSMLKENFMNDDTGKKSGLYASDQEMGESSLCLTKMFTKDGQLIVRMDLRYPHSLNRETIIDRLTDISDRYHAKLQIDEEKKCLYVPKDSEYIKALSKAYTKVTGEKAECITKKGASYARALDNCIAFGASFPGEISDCHMPNEKMPLASLMKAAEIYYETLYELTVNV